ncbi:MAG: hypothetical protein EOO05_11855 [Chitinophagaceae bacterium]|nr:MAG: hypothetical protein EOO05_11855 [Chitinophagaceae bacterium]
MIANWKKRPRVTSLTINSARAQGPAIPKLDFNLGLKAPSDPGSQARLLVKWIYYILQKSEDGDTAEVFQTVIEQEFSIDTSAADHLAIRTLVGESYNDWWEFITGSIAYKLPLTNPGYYLRESEVIACVAELESVVNMQQWPDLHAAVA